MRALNASLLVALAGCVATPGVPVQSVTADAVRGCTFVADLQRATLRDSGSPAADLQRAAEAVQLAAREFGATHVVPGERRMSYLSISAEGRAYRCP